LGKTSDQGPSADFVCLSGVDQGPIYKTRTDK